MALTIAVRCFTHADGHDVRAVLTPVPGLVINEDIERPGRWMVTHQDSGCAVADTADPEGALGAALELGDVADWTRSGADLFVDGARASRWRAWARTRNPAAMKPGSRGYGRWL